MSGLRSRFAVGDRVRVRCADEIAATLDADGRLEGLPFMPEMAAFCGSVFTVRASAHKTCAYGHGIRAMRTAVHLHGVACDGSAHGGCEARCPLFWKDAWLEPADGPWALDAAGGREELARKAARPTGAAPGTYRCQTTELYDATSELPFWAPRQYWDDVRSGNVPLSALLRGFPALLLNKLRMALGRAPQPAIHGTRPRTPDVRLGLQPGDEVHIRTHEEILDTLDAAGRNRGLAFDLDMVPYCGDRAVVARRVETMVDEHTGELRSLRNPCVVLDGVTCRGRYHRYCPRALDCYWREAWVSRP